MKTALTIAGSDSSGGAGIQADLKTMQANGVYGMSAITALTAQNTTGVQGIFEVTPEFLEQEIDSVFQDIFPDAVKIGMVSSADLIRSIAKLVGGGGGGRPNMAQAGGKNPAGIDDAINEARVQLEGMIK